MIDEKELKKIVRFCQKNGILKFKSGDFEIELSKWVSNSKQELPQASQNSIEFPPWESMTPEQRLLWSSTPNDTNA